MTIPTDREISEALQVACAALRAIYVDTGDERASRAYDKAFELVVRMEMAEHRD